MTDSNTGLRGSLAVLLAAMGGGGLLQALLAGRQIGRDYAKIKLARRFWLLGALAVAVYPLAFYGSMRLAGITIGTVVTIGSAPLLSALIEYLFDKQKLNFRWLAGAILGVAGMVLLAFAEQYGQAGKQTLSGIALGLLAGFTYALYSWTTRKMMLTTITPKAAMGATFGLGAVFLLPVLLATGSPLLASVNNFAVGLYMAVVPMFIGYLAFGYGLARVKASTAITITLFEPVVAALLAVVLVGERLALQGWIGIAMILACLVPFKVLVIMSVSSLNSFMVWVIRKFVLYGNLCEPCFFCRVVKGCLKNVGWAVNPTIVPLPKLTYIGFATQSAPRKNIF